MSSSAVPVIEVTDATFPSAVLEESRHRPVVVDFWADWCQPCRTLGPILERLAGEAGGRFLLAKLDVDANPQAAGAFRIQSIPAVKAFRDGQLVDEFIGALPEQSIKQFLGRLIPSEADGLVAKGTEAEAAGMPDQASTLYRQALTMDPKNVGAAIGLGRVAALKGEMDEARQLLEPLRPDPEAERLLAAIEVSEWGSPGRDGEGAVAAAERAAAEGRFEEALEGLLGRILEGDEDGEDARTAMIKVFAVLGAGDPLTIRYRRKLAAALF